MENAPEKLTLLLDNLCAADEAAKSGNLTSNLLRDVSCGIEEDLFPSLEVGELEEMLSAIDLHVGDFKAEHTPAEPKDGLRIAEPTCDDVDRVCSKMDVERSRSVIGERPLSDLRIPPTEETTAERSQKTGGGHFMPMFEEQANYGLHQVFNPTAPRIVVAIDFGTTRSAWACRVSDRADGRIFVRIPESARTSPSSRTKTETAALFDERGRGKLLAFGPAAVQQFADDCDEENALFRSFKVDLCKIAPGQTTIKSVTAESTAGHVVPLLGVITASLVYFKDDVLDFLSSTSGRPVRATDVNWILTVPAIYDDFAKNFMRQAAHEAGMIDRVNSAKLRLCLEPEAACLSVTLEDNPLTCEAEGKKMMILDCGGGTVDITTYRVVSVDPLRLAEVKAPSGGVWGSTRVDAAFKDWLRDFLGRKWFGTIEKTETLLFIMTRWELKRAEFPGQDPTQPVRLILSDLAQHGMSTQEVEGLRGRYNDGAPSSCQVGGKKFMVSLPPALVRSFFEPILDMIADCLREIRRDPAMDDLHRVYVVGGFSRCPLLRDIVQAELERPTCRVLQANEPDLAIVKGAVMFAEKATIFNSRKARLTYGTNICVPVNDKDAEHRRRRDAGKTTVNNDGITIVNNVFSSHIAIGDDVPADGVLTRRDYRPLKLSTERSTVVIYASHSRSPKFVDEDGCFEVGQVSFDLDMTKTIEDRAYRVELRFGGPELMVKILHPTEDRETTDAVMALSRPE